MTKAVFRSFTRVAEMASLAEALGVAYPGPTATIIAPDFSAVGARNRGRFTLPELAENLTPQALEQVQALLEAFRGLGLEVETTSGPALASLAFSARGRRLMYVWFYASGRHPMVEYTLYQRGMAEEVKGEIRAILSCGMTRPNVALSTPLPVLVNAARRYLSALA